MGKKKKKKKNKKKKNIFQNDSFHLNSDSKFSVFEVIIIIFIAIVFGVIIGYLVTYSQSNLQMVRSDSRLKEIMDTYHNISSNYYKDVDKDKLVDAAVKGMVESLEDPYSVFLDDNSAGQFNQSVDGTYVGIGIDVSIIDDSIIITDVHEDGSAKKEGVLVGDIVFSVNNVDCRFLTLEGFSDLIQGNVGTRLKMTVKRGNEKKTFTLTRKTLDLLNVHSDMIQDDMKIGYISISLFSSNSYEQFEDQLLSLEKNKIKGLIIDVRDNPGGHLLQARNVLSMFFNKKTVLYQLESNGLTQKIYATTKDTRSYPVVLLVNGNTASAAEVLVSCFQENYKKVHIVGTTTYGKDTVQKSQNLSTGTSIKFTIQKWLTPKGKRIEGVGIIPDVIVEQSSEYYEDPTYENDTYIQKAIEFIKESK